MEKIKSFTSQKTYLESLLTSLRSRAAKKAYDGKVFRLGLSGGSTPKPFYTLLAQASDFDWSLIEIFLVDERYVPLGDEHSNCSLLRETLIDNITLRKFVHFDTSLPIQESLDDYDQHLEHREGFFDLVLLGLGSDGHTASLFPDDEILHEEKKWVGHSEKGEPITDRLTLTYPALSNAKECWFLITGEEKMKVAKKALQPDSKLPASPILKLERSKIFYGDF